MKTFFTALFVLLFSAGIIAQDFNDDICLEHVKNNLPQGWNMKIIRDTLSFWHNDSVWVKFENKINAPVDIRSMNDRNADIMKYGKKTICRFQYKTVKRWATKQVKEAKMYNDSINKIIQWLAEEKYEVAKMVNQPTKDETYFGLTADEEKRMKAYLEEKHSLEKKRIQLPLVHTEKYSLFISGQTGIDDEMHSVYPQSPSNQAYQVKNLLYQNCEIVN